MKAKATVVLFQDHLLKKISSAAVELQVSKAVSADEGGGDTVQEDSGHYHLDRDST